MTFTIFIPSGLVRLVCGPEAGGAWTVIGTGSQLVSVTLGVFWNRSHTWQQTALRQNWQQLSLKHCFAETNSVITQHMDAGVNGVKWHRKVLVRKGGVLPFLLK